MRSGWIPVRPRLAANVAVRRHIIAGEPSVVLHGPPPASGVACIGEREWAFIASADGTRDLEGIRLAAGRGCTVEHLEAFFEQLAAAGMLEDGPAEEDEEQPMAAPSRAVVTLPRFSLRCDGSGTCCRLYPTTTFLALDVARARSACPDILAGGHHPERVFTPIASSAAASWEPRAVTMVDGRCAYLDGEGSCRIHAAAGEDQKPSGCRLFPMRFVDDGAELRAAPAPECRCVFTSPPAEAAEIAVPEDAAMVERVESEIRVDEDTTWTRAEYRAWWQRATARVETETDGVAVLWELATELSPNPSDIGALVASLRETLAAHDAKQSWRSPNDIAKKVPKWMIEAAAAGDASPLRGENLYLRAIAHAHAWVLDGVPLATSLRERAVRLYVARRLRTDDPDPATSEPIALVEACCRAFHLLAS